MKKRALFSTVILFSVFSNFATSHSQKPGLLKEFLLKKQIEQTKNIVDRLQNYILGSTASPVIEKDQELKIENPLCDTCRTLVTSVDAILMDKTIEFVGEAAISYACSFFNSMDFCWGYVHQLGDIVVENLVAFTFSPNFFCEEVIPVCRKSEYEKLNSIDYINRVLSDKPEIISNNNYINSLYEQIASDPNPRKTIKLLQFTDLHIDFDYVPGSATVCPQDDLIGCRAECGYPTDPSKQAAYYGSFGCDTPFQTFELMNYFISQEVDHDVLFWTGDVPPHDQWHYDQEVVQRYQNAITQQMMLSFPDQSIYPIQGNHDFGSANTQDFTQTDPMIAFNLKVWDQWLDEDAKRDYAKAGYYSQKLKLSDGTVFDKVRIIALNTQVCYIWNFYLWSQRNDPGQELEWLENLLAQMEKDGEIGILVSHIPPSSDCLYEWTIRYKALLERYQHIVRFTMHGHVHEESYGIVRSHQSSQPALVNFWTGSATQNSCNPSFRVFEVDVETMLPVKIHTYSFNISEQSPKWKYDHEFTSHYGMKDLSPQSHEDLSTRIKDDEALAVKFQNQKKQNVAQTLISSCDGSCRQNLYCETRNSIRFEIRDCLGLPRYDMKGDTATTLSEKLADPWYIEKVPSSTI